MSFNFGQTGFGGTSKPTGFGTPYGATPTTSTTGFGSFGSTFGAPATAAPAFGGSTFGAPGSSTAPTFGSTFGTPTAAAAPTFGSSFGTPAATSAPTFGSTFSAPAATSTTPSFGSSFGTPASAAPNLFGATPAKPNLFGAPTQTTPSLFSTPAVSSSLFGGSATPQASGLFGTATSSAPSLFSTTTTTPSLFGTSTFGSGTTAPTGLFGSTSTSALGTTSTGGPGFGLFATTTTAPSLFSGFGTATTTSGGFTGFGAGTSTGFSGFGTTTSTTPSLFGSTLGAKPALNAPSQPTTELKSQQTLASFYAINVFGDERDDILKKWNMLQACWGTGKGYYNSTQPPVEYNQSNPFYRFKAIGYVVIPQPDNADGLVKLHFNKKETELNSQKDVLINGINGILGNKPNLTVTIEHIKALADNESEVMITVSEKGVTGASRKIHATDLSSFLNQSVQKQQLSNVGVNFIGPYMMPTKAQLEEYLKVPPIGIDPRMWQAAQIDNPQPQKYLPTPINGFTDLKKRMICEEYETGLHRAFLEKVNNDINELKRKHAASIAQINEQKEKFLQLQHRVIRILVKQEVTRKVGMALQPEEEIIKGRLELMLSQLGIPTQFKGQLNELLSSVKIMNTLDTPNTERYKMEPRVQQDIRQFLQMEQNGIGHLINIINNDLKDLKVVHDGLNQLLSK